MDDIIEEFAKLGYVYEEDDNKHKFEKNISDDVIDIINYYKKSRKIYMTSISTSASLSRNGIRIERDITKIVSLLNILDLLYV